MKLSTTVLGGTLLSLMLVASASAQFLTFPRIGLSAAPDHYDPDITVRGEETFELYVLALAADDGVPLPHDFDSFHWAVLEACCGGAAVILESEFSPLCEHEGDVLTGVVTTAADCMGGDYVQICKFTMQMATDVEGLYYIIAGPMSVAQTCDGEEVVMTDMVVNIAFHGDQTPVHTQSLTKVKSLFQ